MWTCRRNASGMIACCTKAWKSTKHLRLSAGSVDLAISHGEPGKQMACAATMIARFVQHRLAWACWARRLFALPCLNGGFLIETDQPGACLQECSCLAIGLEHRTSSLQEGDGIMDVLPSVIAPGAKAFGFEPATHRTGRDARKGGILGHVLGQFGSTPAREGHLALPRQATGDGGDLRAYLRGKNASALHCGARQQVNGSPPSVHATCAPYDPWCQRPRRPVGCSAQDIHEPSE